MSRLFCCTLTLACAILNCPGSVTGQPVGGPPNQAPRQENPPPGLTAEDFLRLLFPPEDNSPNFQADQSRSSDSRAARPAPRPVPSAAVVAKMTTLEQRGLLRQAVASLEHQLGKIPHGASWNGFLRIESLGSALWGQSSPSPDANQRDLLKEIAQQYDAVKQNVEYSMISNLWGFQVAHVALPWYAQSEVEKQQRQLGASLSSFERSLSRIRFDAGWKKHFQTDEVKRLASKKEELSEPDEDILREIRRRFDEVQQDDQYRVIRALHGYSETRDLLREIVEAIKTQRSTSLQSDILKSLTVSKDATPLELTMVATLKKLAKIKAACSAEGKAKIQAAMSKKILSLAPEEQKKELARKASEADQVLRLIKENHDRAMSETEKNLQAILRLIKAGRKQEQEGETVLVLPLGEMVQALPLEDSQDEADEVKVLPLDNSKKKEKKTKVLPPEEAKKTKVLVPEN